MNRWDDPGEESVTTRDLYEVLGVARDATDSQIKRAYHKLAMVHHPDKRAQNPSGSDQAFKEIGYAYKILSDGDKRSLYDMGGIEQVEQQEGMQGMSVDHLLLNVIMMAPGQKACFLCALSLVLIEAIVLPMLAALRLDNSLEWSWFGVTAPLWIPLGLSSLVFCLAPIQIKQQYKDAGDDPSKLMAARASLAGVVVMFVLVGGVTASLGMLCTRMDADAEGKQGGGGVSYLTSLIPVLVIEAITACALLGAPSRKEGLMAAGWKSLRVSFVVLTAMKLDGTGIAWVAALAPLVVWCAASLYVLRDDYTKHRKLRAIGKERNATLEEEASEYAVFFLSLRAVLLLGCLLSLLLLSIRLDLHYDGVSFVACVAPMLLSFASAFGLVAWGLFCFKPSGLGDYESFGGDEGSYGTFNDGKNTDYP